MLKFALFQFFLKGKDKNLLSSVFFKNRSIYKKTLAFLLGLW